MSESHPCKICESPTTLFGVRKGKHIPQDFELWQCSECRFSFIANPYLDVNQIYDEDYYSGDGADPLVDYQFEKNNPGSTIRRYEWRGIERIVRDSIPVDSSTRFLDFGCGTGGLVRHFRDYVKCQTFGFDVGANKVDSSNLKDRLFNREALARVSGSFDVITAIEVLEHVPDPVADLQLIRSLLKPGGLFFCTTGNAEPFRSRMFEWRYFIPEIHISYFEPLSLGTAMAKAGFRPDFAGFRPGFDDIIRFKILKNLHVRRVGLWEKVLPWRMLSKLADTCFKVSAHPQGWAE
jgi:SAM-dependent methyltransferase